MFKGGLKARLWIDKHCSSSWLLI